MALLAAFIGIDKHLDSSIRELTGARRDAVALWSLFKDTLPDIDATLLVDDEATVRRVRETLHATLAAAGADDTVILSFSGHGTHDHSLVAHDTMLPALAATTIPMGELATLFKACPARAVLCIIDCCFSGGAPARVLEDSPVTRDATFSLQQFSGNGRILIAASNTDEVALEDPRTGHGLLTKALIDVLRAEDGHVSLPAVMARVMDRVRTAASAFGMVQTPVLLGYVEGALTLPAFTAGAHFFAAFPELGGVHVGAAIADLAAFGLPEVVLTEWAAQFHGGLNALQLQAVNDERLLDGASLLVVAPTSSGKTFIGELAATRAIVAGRKAVFLLPYRALTNEKYDQFATLYGDRLGMRVIRCTGDYLDQANVFIRGKYDLALLTYEMFLNIAVNNPVVLHQVGLVVLDEAQFITDPGRGMSVELLLTYLLAARDRSIAPQIVALAAVVGDTNDFDGWLGCRRLVTAHRPVPLIEGVVDRSGAFHYRDASGELETAQLLPPGAVRVRRREASA